MRAFFLFDNQILNEYTKYIVTLPIFMFDKNDLDSMREILVTALREEVPKIVEDKMGAVLEKRVPTMIEEKMGEVLEKRVPTMIEEKMGEVLEKRVPTMIAEIMGEVLEDNVMPAIDAIAEELKVVKRKLTTMPDRDEVARMLNEATGEIVVKVRNEDKKVNTHIDYSKENGNLSDAQYQELKKIEVFPRMRS